MVSYGWTIDYINENVTLPQIMYLVEQINQHPPLSVFGFSLGKKQGESELMKQIDQLGDKVKYDKWINKPSVKSVIRLRDKVKLK